MPDCPILFCFKIKGLLNHNQCHRRFFADCDADISKKLPIFQSRSIAGYHQMALAQIVLSGSVAAQIELFHFFIQGTTRQVEFIHNRLDVAVMAIKGVANDLLFKAAHPVCQGLTGSGS